MPGRRFSGGTEWTGSDRTDTKVDIYRHIPLSVSQIYEIFGFPLMPRRAVLLTIGVVALGAVLAAIYWFREANCHRMLQTAELAQGSEVRAAIFGGCHIVGSEEALESPRR